MTYHFKIVIDGYSKDKKDINNLYENLQGELWGEDWVVNEPEIEELI